MRRPLRSRTITGTIATTITMQHPQAAFVRRDRQRKGAADSRWY